DFLLSLVHLQIQDSGGNGKLEPGDTANLFATIANVGTGTIPAARGILTVPDADLDGDGSNDPFDIPRGTAYYDMLPGLTPSGTADCTTFTPVIPHPATNRPGFGVSVPAGHPGDVVRRFKLHLDTGLPGGVDLPFFIGIGSACNPADI